MLPCGARLTAADWRANRLVDALAKLGATAHRTSDDIEKLLVSTAKLATHFAAQLGQVTFIANNFEQSYVDDQGENKTRTIRGSTSKPRAPHLPAKPAANPIARPPKPKPTPPTNITVGVAPWSEPPPPSKRARLSAAARARTTAATAATLTAIKRLASTAAPTDSQDDAPNKKQRLLDRIRAKEAAALLNGAPATTPANDDARNTTTNDGYTIPDRRDFLSRTLAAAALHAKDSISYHTAAFLAIVAQHFLERRPSRPPARDLRSCVNAVVRLGTFPLLDGPPKKKTKRTIVPEDRFDIFEHFFSVDDSAS